MNLLITDDEYYIVQGLVGMLDKEELGIDNVFTAYSAEQEYGFKKILDKLTFLKSLRVIFFIIIFLVGVVPCILVQNGILRDYESRAVELRKAQVKGQLRSLANHLISSNYLVNQESGQVDAFLGEQDGRLSGRDQLSDSGRQQRK